MKLPSTVLIADDKIKEYLLSPKKRNDKSKWLAKAGYTLANWQRLKMDLRTQILTLNAVLIDETEDGYSLEVFNALGETIAVVTVAESEIQPLKENEVFSVQSFGAV